jgi:fructokinase
MSPRPLIGAIEAGGTKFVCAVGTCPDDLEETRFPTTTPTETLDRAITFFHAQEKTRGKLAAIGIGTFGPAGVHRDAPDFGFITSTPKPGWKDTDFVDPFRAAFDLPVAFDTDVNAAAVGEGKWGAGQGLHSFAYLTIGTGIGGGAVVDGRLVHGLLHPEIGHLRLPRDPARDPFSGCCPYHGDCLEGLASGPAIAHRWQCDPATLAPDHPAWELEADYLAFALHNLAVTLSPQRFILGGGVMDQSQLFPFVRARLHASLNGYLAHDSLSRENMDTFIVPPALGNQAGILGAFALAQALIEEP